MSNPHVGNARLRLSGVHEWQCEEGSTDATNIAAALDAQIQATLALAYEQRTANLIALWSNPESTIREITWGINEGHLGRLLQEIQQRLGVDK
jgi:hypothetical protein